MAGSGERVLGLDIGGTHFRMGLCDQEGNLIAHDSLPTASLPNAATGLRTLAAKLDPNRDAKVAVAGVPGVVDYVASRPVFAPNLPQGFLAELSGEAIAKVLDRKSLIINDADLAAIGEAHFGAAKSSPSMAYVTVSTGVGAAIVINKKLYHTRFSAGELGHSFIDSKNAKASGEGSVEYLASGTALGRMAHEKGIALDNEQLVIAAKAGDGPAYDLVNNLARNVAVALANVVHLFSVETLVLGGGVILSGDFVFDLIQSHFMDLKPWYFEIAVLRAALGDNAGLAGSAGALTALGA